MEGDQNVDELSKERSAKLVKTWPYVVARYAHVTLARDHVRLCNTTKTTHFQYYRACPSIILIIIIKLLVNSESIYYYIK